MIKSAKLNSALLALTFAVVSGVGFASLTTKANASALVDACRMGSKGQVIACCNKFVRNNGRPLWMQDAVGECKALTIVCCPYHPPEPIAQVPASYDGSMTPRFDTAVFTSFDVAIAVNPYCYIQMPQEELQGKPIHSPRRGQNTIG